MGTHKIIIQTVTPLLSLLLYITIISNSSKEAAAFTSKANNNHYTTTKNKNAQQPSTTKLRQSSAAATASIAKTLEEETSIHQQCQRVTENIIVQEVELNQQIDDNLTILFAARLLQQQQQQQLLQQDGDGGSDNVIPRCEGLLLQKCSNDNGIQRYQAHITCHDINNINNNNISTNATTTSSSTVDHFLSIFHTLLIQYLFIENDLYVDQLSIRNGDDDSNDVSLTSSSTLSISFGSEHDDSINSAAEELRLQLGQLGFSFDTPDTDNNNCSDSSDRSSSSNNNGGIQMNLSQYEPHLNNFILRHRGTEQGNTSLILHKMLCARRMSFQFTSRSDNEDDDGSNNSDGGGRRRRNVISYQPSILSSSVVNEVNDILNVVKNRRWLSTNPDSVDGLPSLHLNLITGSKPLFGEDDEGVMMTKEEEEQSQDDDDLATFPKCINNLVKVLRPHLYDTLLPAARRLLNSTTVEISDVFIRSYGVQQGQRGELEKNDITEDEDDDEESRSSKTRFGLSPHFDVTAYATCVMALDTIASSGQQGLYTIPPHEWISY